MDLSAALLLFAIVTLFTPGPNNALLLASGLNFGLRRTLPHMWGVSLGYALMVLLVGLGLGAVFAAYPALYTALKYAGAAYLLWLAWKIATAAPMAADGSAAGRPFTFLQAAAFQWINPKGWIMAVGANSTYAAIAGFPLNAAVIAGTFGAIGTLSSLAWASSGTGLRLILRRPAAVRAFNIVMALLLVASLYPVLADA